MACVGALLAFAAACGDAGSPGVPIDRAPVGDLARASDGAAPPEVDGAAPPDACASASDVDGASAADLGTVPDGASVTAPDCVGSSDVAATLAGVFYGFAGETLSGAVVASSSCAAAFVYTLEEGPAGLTFTTDGTFSWTVGDPDEGHHAIAVRVSDGVGSTVVRRDLAVAACAPVAKTVTPGASIDADGCTVAFGGALAGVKIEIPSWESAITCDEVVACRPSIEAPIDAPIDARAGLRPLGPSFRLQPEGRIFDDEVRVIVPYDATALQLPAGVDEADAVHVAVLAAPPLLDAPLEAQAQHWEPMISEVDTDAKTVVEDTRQFSTRRPVAIVEPACPRALVTQAGHFEICYFPAADDPAPLAAVGGWSDGDRIVADAAYLRGGRSPACTDPTFAEASGPAAVRDLACALEESYARYLGRGYALPVRRLRVTLRCMNTDVLGRCVPRERVDSPTLASTQPFGFWRNWVNAMTLDSRLVPQVNASTAAHELFHVVQMGIGGTAAVTRSRGNLVRPVINGAAGRGATWKHPNAWLLESTAEQSAAERYPTYALAPPPDAAPFLFGGVRHVVDGTLMFDQFQEAGAQEHDEYRFVPFFKYLAASQGYDPAWELFGPHRVVESFPFIDGVAAKWFFATALGARAPRARQLLAAFAAEMYAMQEPAAFGLDGAPSELASWRVAPIPPSTTHVSFDEVLRPMPTFAGLPATLAPGQVRAHVLDLVGVDPEVLKGGELAIYPGLSGASPRAMLWTAPALTMSGAAVRGPIDQTALSIALPGATLVAAGAQYVILGAATDPTLDGCPGCGVGPQYRFRAYVCGDGVCEGREDRAHCPEDCSVCGDGFCTGAETTASCAHDCPATTACGDGACTGGETAADCPVDCYDRDCGSNPPLSPTEEVAACGWDSRAGSMFGLEVYARDLTAAPACGAYNPYRGYWNGVSYVNGCSAGGYRCPTGTRSEGTYCWGRPNPVRCDCNGHCFSCAPCQPNAWVGYPHHWCE